MEDVDDEIILPDASGAMHLSHRGWKEIPKQVFSNSKYQLLELDLSYNNISILSDSIRICIKLRRLNVSNNQLSFLPDSLSHCHQLEILSCADNKIQTIPTTFVSLQCLEVMDVRNNCLVDVPDVLSQIPCIQSILCSGNSFSFEIPDEFLSTGHLFLWYLKQRHDNNLKVMRAMDECNEIECMCQSQEFSLLQLQESNHQQKCQIESLAQSRPVRYLEFKERIFSTVHEYFSVLRQFSKGVGMAFRR